MTTALSSAAAASATPARDERASRFVEFLAVGGATLFLFPLAWLARRGLGLDDAELAIGALTFYGAWVVNDPHFTVTYFLFYKDARRRASSPRWLAAGVIAPAFLAAWAIASIALRAPQALGWMVQLMYLLVGWHYVKQGFGVMMVLSARRGVRVTPRERAVLLWHCLAGWAFAWANPSAPAGEFEEKGVVYRALAHPRALELATGAVLAASTVALAWVLVAKWRRDREMLPIAPLAGLLVTVWSWTIFSSVDPLLRYLIPALHSIQYFYFVGLMKRNEARAEEGPPTFGRPVAVRLALLALSALALGALLFHVAPAFLDHSHRRATDDLGETPWFAAFFVVVNIHHYAMDAFVWRRENPDTRWLRDAPPTDSTA